MNNNFIKGILFDADGVLFDSEDFIHQSYYDYYKSKYGINLTYDDLEPYTGTGELPGIIGLGEALDLDYNLEADKKGIYDCYAKLIKGKLKLMPGVRSFLKNLRKAGMRMALATSADRVKLEYSLKETGLKISDFDFVVCGDMVAKTKPDGCIYRYAASGLKLDNEECLVIEDALSGHIASKNAHSESIGLLGSYEELPQILSGADLVIRDLSEFSDFSSIVEFNEIYRKKTDEFRKRTVIGKLIDATKNVIMNSYSPYSKFKVGASLLTEDGHIFSGCNVENASFGGTICAERSAMLSAISSLGKVKPVILVVASLSEEPAPPCAICRQFFTEFADSNMQVYLVSFTSKIIRHYNFGTIMPNVFKL